MALAVFNLPLPIPRAAPSTRALSYCLSRSSSPLESALRFLAVAPCFAPPSSLANLSPRAPPNEPAASPHFSRASFFGAPQSFLRFASASRGAAAGAGAGAVARRGAAPLR